LTVGRIGLVGRVGKNFVTYLTCPPDLTHQPFLTYHSEL
jgi:hypothetical protein